MGMWSMGAAYDARPQVPDSPTVALLKGDGANNSTVIADSSLYLRNWSVAGAAKIGTGQSKFGGSSLYFPNSAADYITPSVPIPFGTGNFTWEAFFWSGGAGNTAYPLYTFFAFDDAGSTGFWYLYGGGPGLYVKQGGTVKVEVYPNIPGGTWHHIAMCRAAGTTNVYWNGVSRASFVDSFNYSANTGYPRVGGGSGISPGYTALDWYLDEVRITVGSARYTANFTPPTAPFTAD